MGKYVWPCPSYSRISSGYGNRTCPFHGKEFHDGVDLAAASGAPILAFGPGIVSGLKNLIEAIPLYTALCSLSI